MNGMRHHDGPRRVNVKPVDIGESGFHHPLYRINRLLISSVINNKNNSIEQNKTAASLPYSRTWIHVLIIIPQRMRDFKYKEKNSNEDAKPDISTQRIIISQQNGPNQRASQIRGYV